eukprot:CAMPEP_0113963504 /NCGR_PEP_ID=MMETSP0011_2-20120614/6552_1 /TAXON_ID=101924 /ORGANISM="Rhodosorus marinus" /LENGTH=170 /DNA_ID=CAMNT_0000975565 /DNA_START=670 /DNA_END=1182 /DNA_ORIENTATION=+ /assembly_acc=CAM_ASM_000156
MASGAGGVIIVGVITGGVTVVGTETRGEVLVVTIDGAAADVTVSEGPAGMRRPTPLDESSAGFTARTSNGMKELGLVGRAEYPMWPESPLLGSSICCPRPCSRIDIASVFWKLPLGCLVSGPDEGTSWWFSPSTLKSPSSGKSFMALRLPPSPERAMARFPCFSSPAGAL